MSNKNNNKASKAIDLAAVIVYMLNADPAKAVEGEPLVNPPPTLDKNRAEQHPHGFTQHTAADLGLSAEDIAELRKSDGDPVGADGAEGEPGEDAPHLSAAALLVGSVMTTFPESKVTVERDGGVVVATLVGRGKQVSVQFQEDEGEALRAQRAQNFLETIAQGLVG